MKVAILTRIVAVLGFIGLLSQSAAANERRRDDGHRGDRTSQLVKCKSDNYRYNYCAIPRGIVVDARLVDRVSDAGCGYGNNWGFDRGGIWVDDGCEAYFRVEVVSRRNSDYVRLTCESHDDAYEVCDVRGRIEAVRLAEQLSNAECRRGYNWGLRRGGIWVDRGCRAVFLVKLD